LADDKKKADTLHDILDELNDETLPEIKDKADEKMAEIDKCDDLYDKIAAKLDRQAGEVDKELKDINDLIDKLSKLKPADGDDTLKKTLEDAEALRDDLEARKKDIASDKADLDKAVAILDEVDKKPVSKGEIGDILAALTKMDADADKEGDLLEKTKEGINNIETATFGLMEGNKDQ